MINYQQFLFPYAYNILGSAEDARDTVQEVVYKFVAGKINPENEKSYLIRSVINEAINLKKKKGRTQLPDNWLPEPVATERSDLGLELNELVSYSMLILLEQLNPKERAVFILKEAFDYRHADIAEVLGIGVESSRKLLSRAHQQLNHPRKTPPKNKQHSELLESFVAAVRTKDLDRLHSLLSENIAFTADGGEKVNVVKKYCTGRNEVAELLILVYHRFQAKTNVRATLINHQPALVYCYKNKITTCQVFQIGSDHRIQGISTVVDPDKLTHLEPHG